LYPSADGGFIGKDFVFLAATTTDTYTEYTRGVNFLMSALEDTDFSLKDSTGKEVTSGSAATREIISQVLACRYQFGESRVVFGGSGNSILFSLESSGRVMVASQSTGDFFYVPAFTGGYRGKEFYTPSYVTRDEAGGSAAILVIPYEVGKVTIYDINLEVIAEKTFSQEDVENKNFWFQKFGKIKQNLLIKSEGDISVLSGTTRYLEDPSYLGDDIAFLGSQPNEELRFYAPTSAVVFSPLKASAIINGETVQFEADDYMVLGSGVHTVNADQTLIIQVLGTSVGWISWGAYLIEPMDVTKTYQLSTEKLWTKESELPITLIAGAAIAVAAIIVAFILIRRRRASERLNSSTGN